MVTERIFDRGNECYDSDGTRTEKWLKGIISRYDVLLEKRGYVFLSEVLVSLGFKETYESRIAGWDLTGFDRIGMYIRPIEKDTFAICFLCSSDIRDSSKMDEFLESESDIFKNFGKFA